MLKSGKFRGEKVLYRDGVGCCIWEPLSKDTPEDEDMGICFDFSEGDIDSIIDLLTQLKSCEPIVYQEDE